MNADLEGLRVLEIGGADSPLEGAEQLNTSECKPWFRTYWGKEPLDFEDGSLDMVYASHVLEHLDYQETVPALKEAHRILKPGGWIELWVPDFSYIVRRYLNGGVDDGWLDDPAGEIYNQYNDPMFWVNARIFNYIKGGDLSYCHRTVFDAPYLHRCLERAGFKDIRRLTKTRTRDHGDIQLGMRGTKP